MPRKHVTTSGLEKTHPGGYTDLCVAAEKGSNEKVLFLLLKGASPNEKSSSGKTALHFAAMQGFTSIVHMLLDYNASPFICDSSGHTPLDLALERNQQDVVNLLLYTMNSPHLRDTYSCSYEQNSYSKVQYCNDFSLISAVRKHKEKFVKEAIDAGSFLEEKDSEGNTALCVAATMGLHKIVRLLLDHGACVNVKNHYGRTALHIAAMRGVKSSVEILLMHNASPYARDANGLTPLDLARMNNCKQVEKVLENKLHTYMNAVNNGVCAGFEKASLPLTVNEQCLDTLGQAVRCNGCSLEKRNPDPRRKAVEMILPPTEPLQSQYPENPINNEDDFNTFRKVADMQKQTRLVCVAQQRARKRRLCQLQELSNYHAATNYGIFFRKFVERKQSRHDRIRRRAGMMKHMCTDEPTHQITTRPKSENARKRLLKIARRRFVNNTEKYSPQFQSLFRVQKNAKYASQFPVSQVEEFPTLVYVKSGKKKQENSKGMPMPASEEGGRIIANIFIEDLLSVARERNNSKIYRKSLKKYKKERKSSDKQIQVGYWIPNRLKISDNILTYFKFSSPNGGIENDPEDLGQDVGVTCINRNVSIPKQMIKAPKKKKEQKSMNKKEMRVYIKNKNMDKNALTEIPLDASESAIQDVSVLLNHNTDGSVFDKNGTTPIHVAARKKNERELALFLKAGASVDIRDKDGRTPLHEAALRGHAQNIRVLLQFGASVAVKENKFGSSPLHLASLRCQNECVKTLVEGGADMLIMDARGQTPLHVSAWNGHSACIDTLISLGSPVDTPCNDGFRTALHLATSKGHLECISILLKKGAAVNSVDRAKRSAVHIATRERQVDCLRFLLQNGASVNLKSGNTDTALHMAAIDGSEECISVLLESGARVDSRGRQFRTPLHVAAERGHHTCVQLLLDGGASVQSADTFMNTPLHLAAMGNHAEAVRLLVDAGASCSAKNNKRKTPLDVGGGDLVRSLLM